MIATHRNIFKCEDCGHIFGVNFTTKSGEQCSRCGHTNTKLVITGEQYMEMLKKLSDDLSDFSDQWMLKPIAEPYTSVGIRMFNPVFDVDYPMENLKITAKFLIERFKIEKNGISVYSNCHVQSSNRPTITRMSVDVSEDLLHMSKDQLDYLLASLIQTRLREEYQVSQLGKETFSKIYDSVEGHISDVHIELHQITKGRK